MSDDGRVANLLELSLAPSTRIKYRAMWQRWERFCHGADALPLPADPTVLERFLARTACDGSKTNYKTAVAAIAWRHSVAGHASPTKLPRIGLIIAGAKRLLAAPVVRKAALTGDLLRHLVKFSLSVPSSISDTPQSMSRFRFFVLVAYYAFLRYSDFAVLQLKHFSFYADHMDIKIPVSKCDQYRHGDVVSVAVDSESPEQCPVIASRSHFALLRGALASEQSFVLQSIIQSRDGRPVLGRIASRAVLVAQLRRALQDTGVEPGQFTLHSLRAGGATAAAAVSSVSREELKRHGRWASAAVDNYIEPSVNARLSVTRKMAAAAK